MKNIRYFCFTFLLFFIAIFTVNAETMNLKTDTRIENESLRECLINSYATLNTENRLSGNDEEYVEIDVTNLSQDDILALKKFKCESIPNTTTASDFPKPLNNINGLEIFKGLTSMYIYGTTLNSIDLSIWPNLEIADLKFNSLESVTGLEKMVNLKQLNVSFNQIRSISGLENLSNLTMLWVDDNQLTSIKVNSATSVSGADQGNYQEAIILKDNVKIYNVVYKNGDNYYTNLSNFSGLEPSKVSDVSNGTYDSSTGIVNFGTTKPEKFTYSYDGGKLNVTITLVDALSVKFYANGATLTVTDKNYCSLDSDGNVVCQCTTGGSCTITTPKISKKNYVTLGYATTALAIESAFAQNTKYTISDTRSYYAITKRDVIINFIGNGASIDNSVSLCTWYSNSDSCYLQIPAIKRNGFRALGWSVNKNATRADDNLFGLTGQTTTDFTKSFIVNEKFDVSKTYYAITSKTVRVKFSQNDGKEETTASCVIRNSAVSCGITAPKITAKDGYKILGWALDKDALEGIPVGDIINVTDDQTYYAIMYDSSKNMKTFTAKFEKNGADSIDVKNGELSCNTLNGSCSITAPSFKKDGYEILGWSTDKKATKAEYKPGDIIKLTKDITLYAIYGEKLDTGTTENVDTGISSLIYVLVPVVLVSGIYLYTKKLKRI